MTHVWYEVHNSRLLDCSLVLSFVRDTKTSNEGCLLSVLFPFILLLVLTLFILSFSYGPRLWTSELITPILSGVPVDWKFTSGLSRYTHSSPSRKVVVFVIRVSRTPSKYLVTSPVTLTLPLPFPLLPLYTPIFPLPSVWYPRSGYPGTLRNIPMA